MAGALKKSGSVETETRELLTSKTINLKSAEDSQDGHSASKCTKLILEGLDGDAFRNKGAPKAEEGN